MSESNPPRAPFRKYEMAFEQVDPTLPLATPGPLNVVRGTFRKYTATFEQVDPTLPPATPGPLNVVRGPLVESVMNFEENVPVSYNTLPTEAEIRQLPRWAQVAFAARCARLALPLFKQHRPDAPREHVEAIERAVRDAEESAARATKVAGDVADAVICDARDATVGAAATSEAYYAASAVLEATYAATTSVEEIAHFAARAATFAAASVKNMLIRFDFQDLVHQSNRKNWTDDTAVPPAVFVPVR